MAVGKRYAFTLVELLIVLAIVAILAMVAAPKMVESKLLSKLTQVNKDQRLLQNALDSYYIDYGGYPADQYALWSSTSYSEVGGFVQLTSPIRYLDKVLADPFRITTEAKPFYTYTGASGSDDSVCGTRMTMYQYPGARNWERNSCIHAYLLVGVGPNQRSDTSSELSFPYVAVYAYSYSPTNGTESKGDIFTFMGDYRRALMWLDGNALRVIGRTSTKGGQ